MVDPISIGAAISGIGSFLGSSAGAAGLAGLAGGTLLSSLGSKPSAPSAPAPPAPAQSPTGTPSTNKPAAPPSFLASAATPMQQNTSNKTLLGQ